MEIDTARLSQPDRYKLLIGGIVPRPIALVSSLGASGVANLAPFSFFAGVSSEPMTLLFCPANRLDGGMKDSLRNCLPRDHASLLSLGGGHPAQGEFVVNIVSHAWATRMAACAEDLPPDQSEWTLSGLTPEPSAKVHPARVAESPLCFECTTERVIELAPGAPAGGNIVVGRVVHVRVRDGAINERLHIDPAALDAVARMGGMGYCTTRERFDLPAGRAALAVDIGP